VILGEQIRRKDIAIGYTIGNIDHYSQCFCSERSPKFSFHNCLHAPQPAPSGFPSFF